MTAGLPGTGLGGLYYILLALWMPFHEFWLTLRGRGNRSRWGKVAGQSSIAVGMLAALWTEAWLLKRLLVWVAWHSPPGSYWHAMSLAARTSLIPAAATSICFGILGGVILMTHILRLWLRWASANSQYRAKVPPMPSLPPHGACGRQSVKSSSPSMVLIPHRRNSRAS